MSTVQSQPTQVKVDKPVLKPNQIEKMLVELMEIKTKYAATKDILKAYKIHSDQLTDLKRKKKELNDMIQEEKDRIEDEYLADATYEQAHNEELTLKNQIKEKNAHLRQTMAEVDRDQNLSTYQYNIKGEPLKVQVQRTVKVFINGKEER